MTVIFYVDYKSRVPIYLQVVQSVTEMALNGQMEANAQLPSVRQLSVQLGINPNTVQKAYTMLETRGVIYTVSGRGNFISQDITEILRQKCEALLGELEQTAFKLKELGVSCEKCVGAVQGAYGQQASKKGESK